MINEKKFSKLIIEDDDLYFLSKKDIEITENTKKKYKIIVKRPPEFCRKEDE